MQTCKLTEHEETPSKVNGLLQMSFICLSDTQSFTFSRKTNTGLLNLRCEIWGKILTLGFELLFLIWCDKVGNRLPILRSGSMRLNKKLEIRKNVIRVYV